MISLFRIFLSFVKIGLFAFVGAYAVIPLIEEQMVSNTGWMSFREFSDLIAIDELTPGPIIVNSSTFIGMKLAGLPGAVVATLSCVVPGCLIALLLISLYRRYRNVPIVSEIVKELRCMSTALILSVLIKMFLNTVFPLGVYDIATADFVAVMLVAMSFFVLKRYKANPLMVMLGCGIVTLALSFIG